MISSTIKSISCCEYEYCGVVLANVLYTIYRMYAARRYVQTNLV